MSRMESFSDGADEAVGRRQERAGCLTPDLAGMLESAIGHDASAARDIAAGAEMPRLWHWAAFPSFTPQAELGEDGHPKLGGFLPRLPYQRRMWAGGALSFDGDLRIGEELALRSEILKVSRRTARPVAWPLSRSGTSSKGKAGGAWRKNRTSSISASPITSGPRKPFLPRSTLDFEETVIADEVRLFRFSAATFNAHRIHYDLRYAREVEKYPALVVHGPMQALMLMEAGERHTGRAASAFRFRGLHPMFHDQPMRLGGAMDASASAIDLVTIAAEGHVGLSARMEWAG